MIPQRAYINQFLPGLLWGQRAVGLAVLIATSLLLGACAETQFIAQTVKQVSKKSDAEKRTTFGKYKIGKPYQIKGVWYYPQENFEYDETGIGSWYGPKFHGRKTANGEIYDMNGISAAHRTLPLPSVVRVTNLGNGRTLNVRINDRGPYAHGRILDLSRRAAQLLGFQKQGTASIRVRILADESRAMAARLKGVAELAEIGTPITIDSMPKPKVSSQALPVIGSNEQISPTPVSAPAPPPLSEPEQVANSPVSNEVTLEPVPDQTRIFIQAGAFANFDNANRVRAILSSLGSVKVSPVLVNGRDLFRVRVGPIESIADADHMLEQVIASGYTDARTIVD
ncbi:MAG: septal ring lytic transglycosylase RlpA family protein [Rhodospirillaceae bacterium]|nr:septal ring lytic transglycosylase RlpA family protein [Rhodospirillaceae bacterium]MBL6930343.1 septal ring lytic transglycosylase RlpA family protein [Rhodospirillales bacterium]MBL6941472.1 septal ring lytic transglycosylase RlpA family protein [Rhodospirillales bacterium]